MLPNRWPGDPYELRTFAELRTPRCMALTLQAQNCPIRNFNAVLHWYYDVYTTMDVYKKGSLLRQQSNTILLLKKNASHLNTIQLSSVATFLDHYLRHALTDTGKENHDDCFTAHLATPSRTREFEFLLGAIKHMDFVWLIQNNNTHFNVTLMIVGYLCEDEQNWTDIVKYQHNPFVTSFGDFPRRFFFEQMWNTQTQMNC